MSNKNQGRVYTLLCNLLLSPLSLYCDHYLKLINLDRSKSGARDPGPGTRQRPALPSCRGTGPRYCTETPWSSLTQIATGRMRLQLSLVPSQRSLPLGPRLWKSPAFSWGDWAEGECTGNGAKSLLTFRALPPSLHFFPMRSSALLCKLMVFVNIFREFIVLDGLVLATARGWHGY